MSAATTTGASGGGPLKLQIKTLKGAPLFVTLPNAASTVAELQAQLAAEHGVPVASQRLIFKGKVLSSRDKTLAEYGMEDGDCLHLIVKTETAAPAAAAGAGAGAAQPQQPPQQPMPSLSANNEIRAVPPPAFGFGGPQGPMLSINGVPVPMAQGMPGQMPQQQQQVMFQLPIGAAPGGAGGAIDLGALLGNLFGGLQQPQQPQQQAQQQAAPAAGGAAPAAPPQPQQPQPQAQAQPPRGGAAPAAASAPAPAATAAAGSAAASAPAAALHPQSHPLLSVNAVRSFLTEVAQNVPRLSALAPLSMDPRATMVPAALQTDPFPEDLTGVVRLLAQAREVMVGVTPPVLRRMHGELANLTSPIAPNQPSEGVADTPASRLALQAQLRQLSFGLRRTGDSLRGLATLLEAVQVNPQTGEASLLILPPHLQPGRQIAVGQVPLVQMNLGAGAPVQVPMQPGQQIHFQVQHHPMPAATPQPQQAAPSAAPAPAQPAAPAAAAAPAGAAPPVNPLAAFLAQLQQGGAGAGAGAGAPGGPPHAAAAGAATPQFNLSSILQQAAPMIGPLISNLSQQAAGAGGAEGQPNPIGNILASLGPMFSGMQPPQQQQQPQQAPQAQAQVEGQQQQHGEGQPQHQPQQAAAPQSAPSAVSPPAHAPVSAPTHAAAAAAAAPRASAPTPAAPGGAGAPPNIGSMLSSMLPMLGQMMANPNGGGAGGAGGASLASMMQGMLSQLGQQPGGSGNSARSAASAAEEDNMVDEPHDDGVDAQGEEDGEESASLFDLFLSTLMQHLSLPDLMAMMSGNFSGLEKVHAPFRELLMDLLGEDDSARNREMLAHSFASGIVEGMLDAQSLAPLEAQRIPGRDPVRVSNPVVTRYVRALLDLILDLPIAPASAPVTSASFSSRFKSWSQEFTGEWLVVLGSCFHDGLTSSTSLFSGMLSRKASALDPSMAMMLPMVMGSLTQVMRRCAQAHEQRMMEVQGEGGEEAWLQLVPESERARWQATIAADQTSMQQHLAERAGSGDASLYRPLSRAYLAGSGGKSKRKAPSAVQSTAAPAASAASSSAATAAASSSSSAAAPDTRLTDQFSRMLGRAIQSCVPASERGGDRSAESVVAAAAATPQLTDGYAAEVAAEMRNRVRSQFSGDYSADRYPNIEAQIMQQQQPKPAQ